MTTEQQRRVRELFDAALDQPSEHRRQFLVNACNGDQPLFESVARLLLARERSAGVLDTPVWQRHQGDNSPGEPGSLIGPYKILKVLGGGGMGIVYQAVRADEVFQRICAIKVIRPDISRGWLLQRFREERQILARLDHVNIARIMDGGSTTDGLPYFVMDFVDGPPINKFCSEHDFSTNARLTLFQQVCAAVQYLHKNGVVHGDLKPPNILVGNDGMVKLVDFGIASALSSKGTEGNKALPLMTPGYASPEQMRGKPLTPTSDVYSLGVILYELLTGTQPFPAENRSRSEILNSITTEDPALPSAVVSKSALHFPSQAKIAHTFKGDLDAIVLRAIHRDAERRYQSVNELSGDIQRYLENRPVTARKTSFVHKCRKSLARNRGEFRAGVVICILLAGLSWEGIEWYRSVQYSHRLENNFRLGLSQSNENAKKLIPQLIDPHTGQIDANSPRVKQFQESELNDVKKLAESYRTQFSEAVRIRPGMTDERRDMLDQTDLYLHQVEKYAGQDPRAAEQLAGAWLSLANLQGNPQTVNLHDRVGATASINEAKRLLDKSNVSSQLANQVRTAAQQIEAGK